jgi:E3 ubiquitin-protein ligase RBBP6
MPTIFYRFSSLKQEGTSTFNFERSHITVWQFKDAITEKVKSTKKHKLSGFEIRVFCAQTKKGEYTQ